MNASPNDPRIGHLEAVRLDIREEIKQRIRQRDAYELQMAFSVGAIGAAAATAEEPALVLAAPLAALYFLGLLELSYAVHLNLTTYLREVVEPDLAGLLGMNKQREWENYFPQQASRYPGMRRPLFLAVSWVVVAASFVVMLVEDGDSRAAPFLVLLSPFIVYFAILLVVTRVFWRGHVASGGRRYVVFGPSSRPPSAR